MHPTYIENLLNDPAVVPLQRLLVGFVDVDPDQVGVVLVSLSISQALQHDLDKTETPNGGRKRSDAPPEPVRPDPCVFRDRAHLFSHIRAKVAPTLGHSAPWASRSASRMSLRVTYFAGSLT